MYPREVNDFEVESDSEFNPRDFGYETNDVSDLEIEYNAAYADFDVLLTFESGKIEEFTVVSRKDGDLNFGNETEHNMSIDDEISFDYDKDSLLTPRLEIDESGQINLINEDASGSSDEKSEDIKLPEKKKKAIKKKRVDKASTSTGSSSSAIQHKCDICDLILASKYVLAKHVRNHQRRRGSYACTMCSTKHFKTSLLLKEHTKTAHSIVEQIRPYACNFCEKRFKLVTHMRRHLTIHTGEKPYKCDVCQESFRRADYLKNHQQTHWGVEL